MIHTEDLLSLSNICQVLASDYDSFSIVGFDDMFPHENHEIIVMLPLEMFESVPAESPWSFRARRTKKVGKTQRLSSVSKIISNESIQSPAPSEKRSSIWSLFGGMKVQAEELSKGLYESIIGSRNVFDNQKNAVEADVRSRLRTQAAVVLARMSALRNEIVKAEILHASSLKASSQQSVYQAKTVRSRKKTVRTLTADLEGIKSQLADEADKAQQAKGVRFAISSPNDDERHGELLPMPIRARGSLFLEAPKLHNLQFKLSLSNYRADMPSTPPAVVKSPNSLSSPKSNWRSSISIPSKFACNLLEVPSASPPVEIGYFASKTTTPKEFGKKDAIPALNLENEVFLSLQSPPEQQHSLFSPSLNPAIKEITKKIARHMRYSSV